MVVGFWGDSANVLSLGQIQPGADQRLDPVGVSPRQGSERVPRVPGKRGVLGSPLLVKPGRGASPLGDGVL